jgi:copper chaperone CopZ
MDGLKIKGMSCQHCVSSVQDALEKLSGLSQIVVHLDAGEAQFKNSGVDREIIRNAIKGIGFDPGE